MAPKLMPGAVVRRSLEGVQQVDYYAYLPTKGQHEGRVFVTIHGISRNAEEHLRGFIPLAERYGAVMLAPLFPESVFPKYQRLGTAFDQGRADQAFDQILQDARDWMGVSPTPLHLFGFSGGGQFAHRYAMFYPKRVARMVLGAPGWYTFPDPERDYPFGLRSSSAWPKLRFTPFRFLRIPTLVIVGEEDDIRDDDLNRSRQIDAKQGFNRQERGERWVNAMRALSRAYDIDSDFRFELQPNSSHAYESYIAQPTFAEQVFRFLFGNPLQ